MGVVRGMGWGRVGGCFGGMGGSWDELCRG